MTIIAIDPGANGGIAIYKKNRLEHVIHMPKNLSDLKTYFDYVKENNERVIVFIEKVQMFMSDSDEENKGKQFRIKKLLSNFDQLKSLIVYYGFEFVEVYPITWQSNLGLNYKNIPKTERKNLYKESAGYCFPAVKITLYNADALLILHFALNKTKSDNKWIEERIQNRKSTNLFG